MAIKRQIAYKTTIKIINSSKYVKQEGFEPNYIEANGKKISRVNLVASIVGKYVSADGNYAAITFDDSTDTIRAKAFGPEVAVIEKANKGDVVRFVGKIKEYNEERYLVPEIIFPLKDKNWMIVHALKTRKMFAESETQQVETQENEKNSESKTESVEKIKISEEKKEEDENMPEKILKIIKENDSGEGAPLELIIKKSGLDEESAKNLIVGLLKSGDLFEPTKKHLKVLD